MARTNPQVETLKNELKDARNQIVLLMADKEKLEIENKGLVEGYEKVSDVISVLKDKNATLKATLKSVILVAGSVNDE